MNYSIYNPLLPSNILNLPVDVQQEILSRIYNPIDIITLGKINKYIRALLKSSIKKLDTIENPLYLNIRWLNDYPKLELVNDNIIFNINKYNIINKNLILSIPNKLKKFNIQISCNKHIGSINDINNIIQNILTQIIKNIRLDNYTIRFIIKDRNDSHALIIDNGFYSNIYNFTNKSNLFITQIDLNDILTNIGIYCIDNDTNTDFIDYMNKKNVYIIKEYIFTKLLLDNTKISHLYITTPSIDKLIHEDYI
uniref:F-box domain-containing protein n=1 Tax=Pithovirus LCPAC102 TaxID=2506587 RepID=A0A481Z379_9VIRU|nr:MAG: hypothetical protein LCPAC102_02070 [Pithovirus LCPAC102]